LNIPHIPNEFKYLGFSAILIIVFLFVLRLIMGFAEVEFFNEATEAMAPAIKEGDILVINTGSSSFHSIAVGDVIVLNHFREINVGRVTDIQTHPTGGEQVVKIFITKHDNPAYDEGRVDILQSEEDYIGKVIYVLPPSFGVLVSPTIWIIIAAVISVVLYFRNKRKRKRQEA
jgi:signal peptidase I